MTWVIQYAKKKDCIASDIVMEDFKGDQAVVAMASESEVSVDEKGDDNDFEGHQWIMDTGCGSDLISKAKVEDHKMRRAKAKRPIQLQTANGNTKGVEVVTANIVEFDESIEPCVLPDTPSVMSICRRCMHGGYQFVWLAGKHSYLITPSGKLAALAVEDDIPFIFLVIRGVSLLNPLMTCPFLAFRSTRGILLDKTFSQQLQQSQKKVQMT